MEDDARDKQFKKFTDVLVRARQEQGISQEKLAARLEVSRRTIQNWEVGKSCPTVYQALAWFHVLEVNPFTLYLEMTYPDTLGGLRPDDPPERITAALQQIIDNMTDSERRGLLFFFFGPHGSSPYAVLQMIMADLHCDLKSRVTVARAITENYEMCDKREEIVAPKYIRPDMPSLLRAVESGKLAAQKGMNNYVSMYSMLMDGWATFEELRDWGNENNRNKKRKKNQ